MIWSTNITSSRHITPWFCDEHPDIKNLFYNIQLSSVWRVHTKFIWNTNIHFFFYWESNSSESRRCFESGSVMNNASKQRAFSPPVRSQPGWANMGQHLQHKLRKCRVVIIKAPISTGTRHFLRMGCQRVSGPVTSRCSTWNESMI